MNFKYLKKCVYHLACSHDALEILTGKNPLINENPDIDLDFKGKFLKPSWEHLLNIASNENWEQLQDDIQNHSSSMFVLGYVLICRLILAKIHLYLGNHQRNLDLLCVNFADILEQDKDPLIANSPKKALQRIIKFVDKIYKQDTSMSLYDLDKKYLDEINYQIVKAIHDAFPSELGESINKSIKGDIKIDYIPNYVSKKIITNLLRTIRKTY